MDGENSLVTLIRRIERRMFETVWRVLRHSQDAEDALQNALATVWRQRVRIASHAAPEALVLKICADAAIDQFRRRRRQSPPSAFDGLEESLQSIRPAPVDDAIEHETLEIIMRAITRLSPNQATAVVMRFIQGEPDAKIAAALGCSTATVREHLSRGRERLGGMLGHLAPRGWKPAGSITTENHSSRENEA